MPRKASRAGERTKSQILEVSLPLFAARGFSGTSVRAIAEAAQVNIAAISYHFGDKDGLYVAVLGKLYEELGLFSQSIQDLDAGEDVWRTAVERIWQFCCGNREHIRLAHRHLLDAGGHHQQVNLWVQEILVGGGAFVQMYRPQWSMSQCRMMLVSMSHLVVRFVLEDPTQMKSLLGFEGSWDDFAVDHLTSMAKRELGLLG